jgi:mono/diheme cytochrome c family protein
MPRSFLLAAVLVIVLLALGCTGQRSPSGFRLPAGDVAAGHAAFVTLQCHSCHTVEGAELPAPTQAPVVKLGGSTVLPKTDGEMTTSIILPSAHFARGYPASEIQVGPHSKMPSYIDTMTVRQLADLVAFLQSRYQVALKPVPIT